MAAKHVQIAVFVLVVAALENVSGLGNMVAGRNGDSWTFKAVKSSVQRLTSLAFGCPGVDPGDTNITCSNVALEKRYGEGIDCTSKVPVKTQVFFVNCPPGYSLVEDYQIITCKFPGKWDNEVFTCDVTPTVETKPTTTKPTTKASTKLTTKISNSTTKPNNTTTLISKINTTVLAAGNKSTVGGVTTSAGGVTTLAGGVPTLAVGATTLAGGVTTLAGAAVTALAGASTTAAGAATATTVSTTATTAPTTTTAATTTNAATTTMPAVTSIAVATATTTRMTLYNMSTTSFLGMSSFSTMGFFTTTAPMVTSPTTTATANQPPIAPYGSRLGASIYRKYPETTLSWDAAETKCVGDGAHLAIIGSVEEFNHLSTLAGNVSYFVGIDAKVQSKVFVPVDGSALVVIPDWSGGQPDDNRGNERCAQVWFIKNGVPGLNDLPCSNAGSVVICEKPA